MSELKKRKDITDKVKNDDKDVKTETKRAEGVVDDGSHVDAADKKIELKGTDEGAKEISKDIANAMKSTQDVHKKLDAEQEKRFGEIKKVEKNLEDRSNSTKKDISSINSELGKMKSKDTQDAQKDMKGSVKAAEGDVKFMKDAEGKEKSTRSTGEKEMKSQSSKIKGFKPRRG